MNIRIIIVALISSLTLLKINSAAQNLVLQAYIQDGIKSNLQLQQEQLSYDRSLQNLQLAKALFLPYLSANTSYSWAQGGRKISIPVGDLMNPAYQTLNTLTADSPTPTSFPHIENASTQFLPNDFHDTKLRVIQTVFNPEIYFSYKAQKELITVQQAQKNVYENELKYNITSAYYQYLESVEATKILTQTHTLLKELLSINQKLVANDKATKDVVLNTDYELNKIEQQLEEAEKNSAIYKSYFNFLLNRELAADIQKDTSAINAITSSYTLKELTTTALSQRQEIKQAEGGLQANELLVSLSRGNAILPKINLVGDAGYQGTQYKFSDAQRYWFFQFNLSWDLFKGGEKQAKVQQAKIDYQITENKMQQLKKQIELQVIQSYHEFKAAQRSFITSQSGVKSTEKSFQIIRSKYNEGQAIMLEYLDAENKLTTARMTLAINTYELLRREAALQKTIANL